VLLKDFSNFIFLFNGTILIADLLLGFSVFFQNRKSKINRIFLLTTFSLAVWLVGLTIVFSTTNSVWAVRGLKIAFSGASLIAGFLALFGLFFPFSSKKKTFILGWLIVLISLIFAVVSLVSSKIVKAVEFKKRIPVATYGSWYIYFSLFFVAAIIIVTCLLFYKYHHTKNTIQRRQALYFIAGALIALLVGISTNLLIPIFLHTNYYSQFGPFAALIFLTFIAYAVVRHHLFDVKVVATELFTALLILVLVVNLFNYSTPLQLILNISVLFSTAVFGIFLIRSVLREIKTRERVENLVSRLKVVNEELRKLDKLKSEFISIASHQLRAPLTVIQGYISMILEGSYGETNEKIRQQLEKVFKSSKRLIKLVNDLLSLSRIEAGREEANLEKLSLEAIIDDVLKETELELSKKKLWLKWEKPRSPLPQIYGDKEKLRQVILNIIDNAIRYTKTGGITVNLTKTGGSLLLAVSDTGEGITSGEMARLFESFVRGKAGIRNWGNGAGLGLYVAKKFIKMHGGKIWAESEGKGRGSTFYIELPISPPVPLKDEFSKFITEL
jgi:signal transduction histidine kinase